MLEQAVTKKSIAEKDLLFLQNLLARKREEILHQVGDLESRWQENSEPQIEVEEMAQEVEINEPYAPLDASGRIEVGEIDQALSKIAAGTYGTCETCGKLIPLKRLRSIPWTRFCREDAEREERSRPLSL